jgi:hypothetical protein
LRGARRRAVSSVAQLRQACAETIAAAGGARQQVNTWNKGMQQLEREMQQMALASQSSVRQ